MSTVNVKVLLAAAIALLSVVLGIYHCQSSAIRQTLPVPTAKPTHTDPDPFAHSAQHMKKYQPKF
jgi:disulfide bond formation protein DsbB